MTDQGWTDVVPWTSTGTNNSVTRTGLNLTEGTIYYFTVKAKNGAGLWSTAGNSNGILVQSQPPWDPIPPTTPVVIDEGDYTNSSTQLHATWSSSDPESGIAEYQYKIVTNQGWTDIVPWTSTGRNNSVTKKGLNLSEGATYYFTVKAKNGVGLDSTAGNSDGITVDTSLPSSIIAKPQSYTIIKGTSYLITGTAYDIDVGVDKVYVEISTNGKSTWSEAEIKDDNSWSYVWNLPSDGYYTIRSHAMDKMGNREIQKEENKVEVAVGNAQPIGFVIINGGAEYTHKKKVTLNLIYANATKMRFSNDNNKWPKIWYDASPSKEWRLSPGDGVKTVYAQFKNENEDYSQISDTITLDNKPPTKGVILINWGASATNQFKVNLSFYAEDYETGVSKMMISNSIDFQNGSWEDYVSSKEWSIPDGVSDGKRRIYVRFKDYAGTISRIYSDDIILDTKNLSEGS
jgi:hypothetical protein